MNEINEYLSDPSELIFLGLNEISFQNTSLEKNIAGSKKTLQKITPNMLHNLIKDYYIHNSIISISGDISLDKTESLIKQYFNKQSAPIFKSRKTRGIRH